MKYAKTGLNLGIDLTWGNIEKGAMNPKETEAYLGRFSPFYETQQKAL